MAGHGELQIHECLGMATIQMEDSFGKIKQAKRGDNANRSQHGGDGQHQPHIPGFGLVSVQHVVIGDR
jgi:hypothetical protein